LDFAYSNYFPSSITNVDLIKLLFLSKKIGINELTLLCQRQLLTSINVQNAFDLLILCDKFGQDEEVDCILTFLRENKISFTEEVSKNLGIKLLTKSVNQFLKPYDQMIPNNLPVSLKELLPAIRKLYEEKVASDFVIKLKFRIIRVHKCIIGYKWQYFTTYLLNNDGELVTDLPIETLEKLIAYFYTGDLQIFKIDDCGWILSTASHLMIEDQTLLNYCKDTITSQITSDNWYEGMKYAIEFDNEVIEKKALKAAPDNINQQVLTFLLAVLKHNKDQISQQQYKIEKFYKETTERISNLEKSVSK